jgi:hypothetical protein
VTKYISSEDNAAFEETAKDAKLFKKLTVAVIPDHSSRSCKAN